jgi:AraC-like DNA-binding protein
MRLLMSSQARPQLRPYVRAYAQRVLEKDDSVVVQTVPAMVEQILNLEFGIMPGIIHQGTERLTDVALVGGIHSSFSGYLELYPGVESFAVFFQPAGWSLLFKAPLLELTNRLFDVTAIAGSSVRILWNRMGEASTFERRVQIVEEFLLDRVPGAAAHNKMTRIANHIFRSHGACKISSLAGECALGQRQFERDFERETGITPKTFARIARFQAALDAKLTSPRRTWLDIAHSFHYYDQMHMIHDFEKLGRAAPTEVIAQMGDVRPPALTAEKNS